MGGLGREGPWATVEAAARVADAPDLAERRVVDLAGFETGARSRA